MGSAVERLLKAEADLYQTDFYAWCRRTAERLRTRDFSSVDWNHIVEEIEALGARDRRELYSRIQVIIIHLLKWKIQSERRSMSWRNTLDAQRSELDILLNLSPSLRNYLEDAVETRYPVAVKRAVQQMGLLADPFPAECPFTPQQILDDAYLPD